MDTEIISNDEATLDQDYTDFLNRHVMDSHEEDMRREIRKGMRTNFLLFLLLIGMIYANIYQLRQTKLVPFISEVDQHGEVVVRKLIPAKDVSEDDSPRKKFTSDYIKKWVINGRFRSSDKDVTGGGIRSALNGAAGPARINLAMEIKAEEVWKRIDQKRERVQVLMLKWPAHVGGKTWQAEWEEVTTGPSYIEPKRQMYSGTFEIVQQDNWITMDNPWGIHVVNATREPFQQ